MKIDMKRKAIQHTELMEKTYSKEIKNCIKNSKIYEYFVKENHISNKDNMTFSLLNMSSTAAIQHTSAGSKVALLNFASYKNPGGGFYRGMTTQEEALCHDSFLFNVLISFMDYYNWNREHSNRGLYLDRAIYSPDVLFTNLNRKVDVITCAAPNYSLRFKHGISAEENSVALRNRIRFVLDIAEDNNVDTLILGAYGCGVFQQDPREVATIFIQECKKRNFKNIIFPIIDRGYNYDSFDEILDKEL